MKKRNITPLIAQILKKVAPRIGATVMMEPKWKIVGQITYRSGQKRYFRSSSLDLNSLGASEVARDKDYANFFLARMGYPIVPGSKTFFARQWAKAIGLPDQSIEAAYHYAAKLGFPVIVKPNSGSQGTGVTLVHNRRELYQALRRVFLSDRVALVQQPVDGKDYRLVVLDDKVISVYQRIPLNVVGNGRSTIGQLLRYKQRQFIASSRDTCINSDDPRILKKLRHQKLSFDSVLARGHRVYLLDNANLSTGGDSVDVTAEAHMAFKKIAVQVTKDMGLRLCGVDLMIAGDITQKPDVYWVLEINSAPGLDHYAHSGKAQEKIVEDLYLEVLKSMER